MVSEIFWHTWAKNLSKRKVNSILVPNKFASYEAVSTVWGQSSPPDHVLIGPDGQTSDRNGYTGNLGQFEARLLRLLAPSSNLASDDGAVAGSSSPVPTPASPDPAALAAAAALDPLATSNILGLFGCFFIEFYSQYCRFSRKSNFLFLPSFLFETHNSVFFIFASTFPFYVVLMCYSSVGIWSYIFRAYFYICCAHLVD